VGYHQHRVKAPNFIKELFSWTLKCDGGDLGRSYDGGDFQIIGI